MSNKSKLTVKKEAEPMITRGMANMFFNTLGAIKSYTGVTAEGSTIILLNRRRFGRIVEETVKMEQDFIVTLQTDSFKQANEIVEGLKSTATNRKTEAEQTKTPLSEEYDTEGYTASERETLTYQQGIITAAEKELQVFQNNMYSKEVPMPNMEYISRADFVALVAANLIDEPVSGEERQAGLYSGSVEILSELLIKTEL